MTKVTPELAKSILRLARLLQATVTAPVTDIEVMQAEFARINPAKPYKRRRLKMDPVSVMRRRITKMQSRDPKIKRKKAIYRKIYNRKNKQLLKQRREFVREAKKRLPPPPGHVAPKRKT